MNTDKAFPGGPVSKTGLEQLVALAGVLGLFSLFLQAIVMGNGIKYQMLGIGIPALTPEQKWAVLPDFLTIAFGSAVMALVFGGYIFRKRLAFATLLPVGLKELPRLVAAVFFLSGLVHLLLSIFDAYRVWP